MDLGLQFVSVDAGQLAKQERKQKKRDKKERKRQKKARLKFLVACSCRQLAGTSSELACDALQEEKRAKADTKRAASPSSSSGAPRRLTACHHTFPPNLQLLSRSVTAQQAARRMRARTSGWR